VQSIPDKTPSVHPTHSVAIVGAVTELKSDGGRQFIDPLPHLYTLPLPDHAVNMQCGQAKARYIGSDSPPVPIARLLYF